MIKERAEEAGIEKIERNFFDVTYLFNGTDCNFIRREIKKGGKVLALKIPNMKNLFTKEEEPQRSFAVTLCDQIKKMNKCGFITTDELPAYGISQSEVDKLRSKLNADPRDLVVLVASSEEIARKSLDSIASYLEMIIYSE